MASVVNIAFRRGLIQSVLTCSSRYKIVILCFRFLEGNNLGMILNIEGHSALLLY